jgi:hypothetical protein
MRTISTTDKQIKKFTYMVHVIGVGQNIKVLFGPAHTSTFSSSNEVSKVNSGFSKSFEQEMPPLTSAWQVLTRLRWPLKRK